MIPTVPIPLNALEALNHWAPIVWLKTNPYAYPSLEIAHIIGIALVFGDYRTLKTEVSSAPT